MTKIKTSIKKLKNRLYHWEKEKENNKFGMQHLADRAIKLIRDEIILLEKNKVNYNKT